MDENKELDLDKKVTVRSIAPWNTGFQRYVEMGDANIAPFGSIRMSRAEIIAQHQNGNKLINGVDGMGSHATLIIEDADTRKELGFDSEDGKTKQLVFSDDLVKKVFEYKTQSAFEQHFKNAFVTRAEKNAVMVAVKRLKINDFSKIRFAENYTGFRYED